MTPEEKSELLLQLNEEMDRALTEYFAIQKELDRIILESPSGLPLTDGVQRVVNTGRAARHAFHVYQSAMKRLRDYLENGTVPDADEPG